MLCLHIFSPYQDLLISEFGMMFQHQDQLPCEIINNSCVESQRETPSKFRLDVPFDRDTVLNIGGLLYFGLAGLKPCITIKSEPVPRLSWPNWCSAGNYGLALRYFFFSLFVGLSVAEPILNFA